LDYSYWVWQYVWLVGPNLLYQCWITVTGC